MDLRFYNKSIESILTIVPSNQVKFEDEMEYYNFPAAKSLKLKLAMGYGTHCIVEDGVCSSDLLIRGFEYLFDRELLHRDEIDALVLVTQSPDHFMPPTSNIIQGKLGLKKDTFCIDINQGCTGFIVGLIQAFMLLEQENIKKVAVLNAEVLSRKASRRDRNSYPLSGDGASITMVVKSPQNPVIYGSIKMDGTSADVLMIPAGGFRIPSSTSTAEMKEDPNGNFRSLDNLVMKGDEVFNFVQREVPPMVNQLLETAGISKNAVDYYLFHQPNRFMLQKLADKLEIPHEKMPHNVVENFGNSSGVSIPTVIAFNLGSHLVTESYKVCLAGFGVGLAWGALLMDLGKMKFCEMIRYE